MCLFWGWEHKGPLFHFLSHGFHYSCSVKVRDLKANTSTVLCLLMKFWCRRRWEGLCSPTSWDKGWQNLKLWGHLGKNPFLISWTEVNWAEQMCWGLGCICVWLWIGFNNSNLVLLYISQLQHCNVNNNMNGKLRHVQTWNGDDGLHIILLMFKSENKLPNTIIT